MDTALDKLLTVSQLLFLRFGIRNVTMDDIAREMGISKKTIYQFVENKADLICKGVTKHIQNDHSSCIALIEHQNQNAIAQMLYIANHVYRQLTTINFNLVFELRKFYPEIWQLLEKHRIEFVPKIISDNISKGISEGLYRQDIQADIITQLYLANSTVLITNTEFIKQNHQLTTLYTQMLKYHLFGIASTEGVKYLNKNFDQLFNNTKICFA
ncbi:MAG: TetR/AcrR family transcriptional regulator [Bacteroidetes bacterium]|nr:TetR/AcrR family transcriptional regulator [Bacteroidota bacterium]